MRDTLYEYFQRRRKMAISRYKSATLWVQRQDARSWALHYGRLMRMRGRV